MIVHKQIKSVNLGQENFFGKALHEMKVHKQIKSVSLDQDFNVEVHPWKHCDKFFMKSFFFIKKYQAFGHKIKTKTSR